MKRYESLRTLFWVLAASLSSGVASATTATATNADGDTLVVGTDNYGDIANFSLGDTDLDAVAVATTGADLTLAPGSYVTTLTIDGASNATLSDNYTFDSVVDDGPMTLRFTPGSGATFTNSGTYVSSRSEDIMEIAGDDATAVVNLTGDISGFKSHLKSSSGVMNIYGTTGVMTHADGGLISIESGAENASMTTTGSRDIGADGSGLAINIASGKTVTFGDSGSQNIYAAIQGAGAIAVTGGTQTFAGPSLAMTGGVSVSGGNAVVQKGTSSDFTLSGSGNLVLNSATSATYSGNIAHDGNGNLDIDSAGNVITLSGTNTSSGAGGVVVSNGELRMEDSAIFEDMSYSGSGVLHFDSATNKTLSESINGSLDVKKSGSSEITLTSGNFNTTGAVNIYRGKLIIPRTAMTSTFIQGTSDIAIDNGAELEFDIDIGSGSSVDISGRTFSGDGTLTLNVADSAGSILLGGSAVDVGTVNMTGTPTSSTFKLVFDGANMPTSNIERSHALHAVEFSGLSGVYDGTIDATAGNTNAAVNLTNSSAMTFTNAGFNGELNIAAGSSAQLEEEAIHTSRVVSGAGDLTLNPAATHTFASNVFQGSGTLTVLGGSTDATQLSITAAQDFTGIVEIVDGYVVSDQSDLFANASAINLRNTSFLSFPGSVAQMLSVNVFDQASVTGGLGALAIAPTGILLGLNATNNETITEDMSTFEDSITVKSSYTLDINGTAITLGAPGAIYALEDSASDGSLLFSNGTVVSLEGTATFNTLPSTFVSFDNATLQFHPSSGGPTKALEGTGGIKTATNNLNISTAYGRSIIDDTAQGVKVDEAGQLVKEGFGDFVIKRVLTTTRNTDTHGDTPSIVVNGGNLQLHSDAGEDAIGGARGPGNDSDIQVSGGSYVDLHLGANAIFRREIGGAGGLRIYADGQSRTLEINEAVLQNTGDFIIGDNVQVEFERTTNGTFWAPGASANIEISATNASLTLEGRLHPIGTHFNPHFASGNGTIYSKQLLCQPNASRDFLIFGNSGDTLSINSSAEVTFEPRTGETVDFRYNVASADSSAVLETGDAGDMIFQDSNMGFTGFTGTLGNSGTGSLTFKNKVTADFNAATKFNFGTTGGTTIFDLSGVLELQSTNALTNGATGNFVKRGSGSLVFDATAEFSSNSGDFNIYAGRSEWHQVERGTAHHTIVHRGAGLYVSREWNGHGGAIEVGHVELKSGSRLVLSEQVWDTPASAAANGDLMSVNISRLDAEAGSELVFHLNPNRAVTGADTPNLSAYAAPMTLAASFGSGTQTAPIYVRAVAVTTADLTANDIYPLIKFANTTDANALAGKIKVRPSIKGVQSSLYYMDSTYGGVDPALHTHYGQPYRYTDSNDSGEWLVLQVNDDQFAPGRLAAKTDFSSHAHPNGTYTVAYALMEQDFMAYSALDGLLAAINGHNRSLDYHLSLLQPSSYQSATVAFNQSSLLLQPLAEQGMAAIAEQQRWAQAVESDKLAGIYASLNAQQNLSSDTEVKAKGRTQSWTTSVQGLSFADETASHKVDAKVQGAALRLSSSLAVGYQHVAAQHAYAELSGQSSGSQNSHYGSGFVQMTAGDFAIAAQSTLGLHHNSHERVMNIDVAEGLTDNWVATSAYQSYEAQQEATVTYNSRISDKLSIGGGMKAVANARFTPEYAESGADNLNLVVEVQNHGYALATPMVSVDYRAAGKSGFMSSRLTAGYQAVVAQSNAVTYGLSDFEVRDEMRAEQPAAVSGWTAGYELGLMSQEGLSFQLRYNTVAAEQHQGQLSVSYDF